MIGVKQMGKNPSEKALPETNRPLQSINKTDLQGIVINYWTLELHHPLSTVKVGSVAVI